MNDDELKLRIEQLQEDWSVPKRFLVKSELALDGPWGAAMEKVSALLGTGFLVALIGPRGTGKTQMAVVLMHKITKHLRSAKYRTAEEILLDFKATFRPNSEESERDVFERFCRYRLLVIDEATRRSDSDWANQLLFAVIDRRYGEMKDTVLISNQTKDVFDESLGESVVSRLNETGGIIECNWPTFRQ